MLAVIKRDLYYIILKYKKQAFCFLLTFIVNFIILKLNNYPLSFDTYIGLNFAVESVWYLSFYLLINGYYIYLNTYLYHKDFDNSIEFILTRISRIKWIISKIITAIILSTIIYGLLIMTYFLIGLFFQMNYNIDLINIIYLYLFLLSINLTYLSYNVYLKKYSLIFSVIFVLFIYYLKLKTSPINLIVYIVINIILIILNYILFERSEKYDNVK